MPPEKKRKKPLSEPNEEENPRTNKQDDYKRLKRTTVDERREAPRSEKPVRGKLAVNDLALQEARPKSARIKEKYSKTSISAARDYQRILLENSVHESEDKILDILKQSRSEHEKSKQKNQTPKPKTRLTKSQKNGKKRPSASRKSPSPSEERKSANTSSRLQRRGKKIDEKISNTASEADSQKSDVSNNTRSRSLRSLNPSSLSTNSLAPKKILTTGKKMEKTSANQLNNEDSNRKSLYRQGKKQISQEDNKSNQIDSKKKENQDVEASNDSRPRRQRVSKVPLDFYNLNDKREGHQEKRGRKRSENRNRSESTNKEEKVVIREKRKYIRKSGIEKQNDSNSKEAKQSEEKKTVSFNTKNKDSKGTANASQRKNRNKEKSENGSRVSENDFMIELSPTVTQPSLNRIKTDRKAFFEDEVLEKYGQAIEKLQEYSRPDTIPCREEEKNFIYKYLMVSDFLLN